MHLLHELKMSVVVSQHYCFPNDFQTKFSLELLYTNKNKLYDNYLE